MAFQQRGRLLVPIKTQVVPIGDLGLPIGGVEGLQFPDDLPPFLAVNAIQTPTGPRIIQGDSNGHLLQTLPKSTQVNLIAPRTDITTFTSPDFQSPAFTTAIFFFRVTAISGTTPQVAFSVQTKESGGGYSITSGGANATAITTVTAANVFIVSATNSAAALIGPVYHILATITGTTPSVTWFCDLVYK